MDEYEGWWVTPSDLRWKPFKVTMADSSTTVTFTWCTTWKWYQDNDQLSSDPYGDGIGTSASDFAYKGF